MVWFQCEDCGENLKKPKLPSHFRICSAYKLSCIDCGETFTQQSVQGHTQCISEAEKYGPKDQAKSTRDAHTTVNKLKPALDIDVNVGLSTRPPWFCSLCNTTTTSKQTLLLHADGKKHRAKAKAYHAAQKQGNKPEESAPNTDGINSIPTVTSNETENAKNPYEMKGTNIQSVTSAINAEEKDLLKKRKFNTLKHTEAGNLEESNNGDDLANGEVIQSNEAEEKVSKKRKKYTDSMPQTEHYENAKKTSGQKIRWKKLITSILKSNSDEMLKVKRLQKLVAKALQDSGVTEDKEQLKKMMMDKISSSSRFVITGKHIYLAKKDQLLRIASD